MRHVQLDPQSLGTVLSVWAHPDDETYLAGGVMAAAADAGLRVVCVTATAGERGTTDERRWPPERLGHVRRLESAAAMAVLGVREHRVLGLPDGALADHERRGRALVGALLEEIRPDTVLTFGPDGMTFHPDHVAVHRWVDDAWRRGGRRGRVLHAAWTADQLARFGAAHEADGVYMDTRRPVGTERHRVALHVELRGGDLDRKVVALRAMATQTAALVEAHGVETYAERVAEETFVDAC